MAQPTRLCRVSGPNGVIPAAPCLAFRQRTRRACGATLTAIAGTAARGFVSPLRFAGANPGVLAGLACIRWKLRGPSLTFAMAPDAVPKLTL